MNRRDIIEYLACVGEFMKLSKFARLCGINPSNLSQTLLYKSYSVSDDKLILLYKTVKDYAEKIA